VDTIKKVGSITYLGHQLSLPSAVITLPDLFLPKAGCPGLECSKAGFGCFGDSQVNGCRDPSQASMDRQSSCSDLRWLFSGQDLVLP